MAVRSSSCTNKGMRVAGYVTDKKKKHTFLNIKNNKTAKEKQKDYNIKDAGDHLLRPPASYFNLLYILFAQCEIKS